VTAALTAVVPQATPIWGIFANLMPQPTTLAAQSVAVVAEPFDPVKANVPF
jgi:hypothetical protein